MLGKWLDRRGFALALTTLLLAACSVVPKTTAPTGPVEVTPDATVLPNDDGRHRIALLVPLTGTNGAVGKSIENATTMALLETNAANLRITTYDTATGASAAAAQAIREGNKLILGPLLGEETGAVIAAARPAGVPLISFSNDVTSAARDVFIMGQIPDQSISRSVAYARTRGASKFAALIPNGEYGARAEAALSSAVVREGGALMRIERYDRSNTSITAAAKRLAEKGGYDTVLIADGSRLSVLAAQTFAAAASRPHLLGTELWNGESRVAESTALNGAWFATVSETRFRAFNERYKTRFGVVPHRISSLGYDAVLLTLKVSRNWKPGTKVPLIDLLDRGGFIGVDGPFRFSPSGIGERAMEVREVRNGTISVVSAAPARFED